MHINIASVVEAVCEYSKQINSSEYVANRRQFQHQLYCPILDGCCVVFIKFRVGPLRRVLVCECCLGICPMDHDAG